jgi:hypothetical protein
MAANAILKETLTPELVRAGRDLTERLLQELPVTSAFWLYRPESKYYRLMIGTPAVRERSLGELYAEILETLEEVETARDVIALRNVSVIEDSDPLASILPLNGGADGEIIMKEFAHETVDGRCIEHAVIYRRV